MRRVPSTLAALSVLAAPLGTSSAANAPDAVLGDYWTQKKDAITRFYKKDDRYFGKLIWVEDFGATDDENPDPKLRERPLLGLEYVFRFRFNGKDKYVDGEVYAPDDGKTYAGWMKMDGPDVLKLRGYVGISLFGRTETMARVKAGEYPRTGMLKE